MARVSKGAVGEVLAARYLRDKGYTIEAANYRCRFGEIDIIASDETYIVFVEVKTRAENSLYHPREAVTRMKQHRIIKTAKLFLQQHPSKRQPRFDVIEIYAPQGTATEDPEIYHLEDAFQ